MGVGMRTPRSNLQWRRPVLAVLLGTVMVLGCAGQIVRAEGEEDDEWIDTKIFKSVLHSLGLRKDGDGIEYRERAPLVLPPSRTLPPPEGSAAKAKAADWPDDPDVKRARKQKAERKAYNPEPEDAGRPLLPNQYSLPGRGSPSSQPNGTTRTIEDKEKPMSPYELGTKGILSTFWAPSEEYSTFTSEPPRERLIDPPPGYRTPSPAQPYGVGKAVSTSVPSVVNRNDVVK
jgi:hypothetical protein